MRAHVLSARLLKVRGMRRPGRSQAAILGAHRMERSCTRHGYAEGVFSPRLGCAFFQHVHQRRDKRGVRRDCFRALIRNSKLSSGFLRLSVQVVDDLHVVADKADGDDYYAAGLSTSRGLVSFSRSLTFRGDEFAEEIVDVGLQPARLRRA